MYCISLLRQSCLSVVTPGWPRWSLTIFWQVSLVFVVVIGTAPWAGDVAVWWAGAIWTQQHIYFTCCFFFSFPINKGLRKNRAQGLGGWVWVIWENWVFPTDDLLKWSRDFPKSSASVRSLLQIPYLSEVRPAGRVDVNQAHSDETQNKWVLQRTWAQPPSLFWPRDREVG